MNELINETDTRVTLVHEESGSSRHLTDVLARWGHILEWIRSQVVAAESVQVLPVVQMEQSRFSTDRVALPELHHQQPICSVFHKGAVGVQCERTVGLAQVRVTRIGILDFEAGVVS